MITPNGSYIMPNDFCTTSAKIQITRLTSVTRSSANRPRDASLIHSRSLKIIRNYTVNKAYISPISIPLYVVLFLRYSASNNGRSRSLKMVRTFRKLLAVSYSHFIVTVDLYLV